MPPILSVSAFLLRPLLIRAFPLPRKVTFKSNLPLRQWLVCTIFSAIIFLHLRIDSSKNYSLISLHVFTRISSFISPTNTLRMMNFFNSSVSAFYSDNSTYFSSLLLYLFIFYATPRVLPQLMATKRAKEPPAENDRRPAPALGKLVDFPEASGLTYFLS